MRQNCCIFKIHHTLEYDSSNIRIEKKLMLTSNFTLNSFIYMLLSMTRAICPVVIFSPREPEMTCRVKSP